jgi:transcriptional regulator with XRE-family HTH domain
MSLRQVVEAVEALGIPMNRGNLSRTEHGQPGGVGFKKLPPIAQVLGIDVEELLTDHGKALAPLEKAS